MCVLVQKRLLLIHTLWQAVCGVDLGPPACLFKVNMITLWREHFVLEFRIFISHIIRLSLRTPWLKWGLKVSKTTLTTAAPTNYSRYVTCVVGCRLVNCIHIQYIYWYWRLSFINHYLNYSNLNEWYKKIESNKQCTLVF